MPNIPGVGYTGSVPGPIDRPAPAQATPSAFGAGTGAALGEVGKELLDLGAFMEDTYQETRAKRSIAESQKSLQDFTLGLKYGSTDEEGNKVPPPEPGEHVDLYQKEVERIREQAGKNLSGRAYRMFDEEFTNYVTRGEFQVRSNAIEHYNNRIQADADITLQQSAIAYVDGEDIEKPSIKANAFKLIDELERRGTITPQEALTRKRKFNDDAETGAFYKIMMQNPDAARAALKSGEFDGIDADKRQKLDKMAIEESDRRLKRANMELEREERLERRNQKDLEEETAKTSYELFLKGQLTPAWVMNNRDKFSKEDYKIALRDASGRGEIHADPETLADLNVRASYGENVIPAAKNAAAKGLIGTDHLVNIINKVKSEGVAITARNWRERGRDYIKQAVIPQPDIANISSRIIAAKALDQWIGWADAHPDATQEQAQKEYESIVNRALITKVDDMLTSKLVPRFLKGRRTDLKDPVGGWDVLQQTAKATKEAFEKGEIDEQEYAEEQKLLTEYGRLIKRPEPKAAQPKK